MSIRNGTPRVLVTDAGRGSAIAIIRSLGRRGWHVIAADSSPASLGFRSRYVRETLLYPEPDSAPEQCVDALVEAAQAKDLSLVIPVTDAIILPLAQSRDRFPSTCRLGIPSNSSLEVATDKYKTQQLAERLGVPAPRTYLVQTVAESIAAASNLGWPMVLKPQVSRLYRSRRIESFKVTYAPDLDRLRAEMGRLEGRCAVLMQEFVHGEGHGVELLMDRGRPLAAFQHRRLRELPINGGPSTFRESVPLDADLYRYSVQLLEAMEWTGPAMVEFKQGSSGPRLMEINGRIWGSLPLASHCGVDFPGLWADLLLYGAPAGVPVPGRYSVGVRARNLELDLMWIASVLLGRRRYPFLSAPTRGAAVTALAGLLNPAWRFDIQSWEDPRPGLAEIPQIIRKFLVKFRSET